MEIVKEVASSASFWVTLFFAIIGGLLVLRGLILENDDRTKRQGERLVITGVFIEVLGAIVVTVISGIEVAASSKLAGEANKEAGDAIKQAGYANERASSNEWQVAVLSNQTVRLSLNLEEAKSNNLELQKQVLALVEKTKVRTVSQTARTNLGLLLNGVPKGSVEIIMSDKDAECMAFGLEIKKTLVAAGFPKVVFSPREIFRAMELAPELASSRVDLVFCVKNAQTPPRCSELVFDCFSGDGILTFGGPYNELLSTNDFQIWILPKPVR
jgi:hypothetical protein